MATPSKISQLDLAEQNARISRSFFRLVSITTAIGALIWIGICIAHGYYAQAAVGSVYILQTIFGLLFIHRTGMVPYIMACQVGLGILTPLAMQAVLGGVLVTGMAMFWSFCTLPAVLTYKRRKYIIAWCLAAVPLICIWAYFDPVIPIGENGAPLPAFHILFTLNVVGPMMVIFGTAIYFVHVQGSVRKRNHAMKLALGESNARLAERNKEIEESLVYARHIQRALQPDLAAGADFLSSGMVFDRPKDHVGGDMVWLGEIGDHRLVVVADCTGHGVPGALLTLLLNHVLNDTVLGKGLSVPEEIIPEVITRLSDALHQSDRAIQDSAEMAVIRLDTRGDDHLFAGYGMDLLSVSGEGHLFLRGDLAIPHVGSNKPVIKVRSHPLTLTAGTRLFAFSDGFSHQIGGAEGRKYSRARLQRVLINSMDKSLATIQRELDAELENWVGELEQLDDILVVGLEPRHRASHQ